MLRGIITTILAAGLASAAIAAEPDTTVARHERPRPTATTPT